MDSVTNRNESMFIPTWEYKIVQTDQYDFNRSGRESVSEYGREGWELVSATALPGTGAGLLIVCVFKRPLGFVDKKEQS